MHCTEVMYHTDDSKVVSESCNIAAWYAKFSINSQSRLETIKLTKYRPPDVQHSVTVPSQWLRHVHETACRRLSGMHRRWRRSVMSWRLLFRSSFDNDWAIVIVLQSITVVCPRLLTVGDSVVLFFFSFKFCMVPLQCLWRDSVTLISTLLLTYLLIFA